MGRRDISFYDLYKLKEPKSDAQNLVQEGYQHDGIYDPSVYEDMEVNDYNFLWQDQDIIGKQFGKSIRVNLATLSPVVQRRVIEDLGLAKIDTNLQRVSMWGSGQTATGQFNERDIDL